MKTLLVVALIALTALAACDDSGPRGIAGGSPFGTQDNEEAALAALWLSEKLTAPYPLYKTIADDLAAIRSAFADSTTMTSIGFFPPWVPSTIIVRLTNAGAERLRDGEFEEFNKLGLRFGLTRVDTATTLWNYYRSALLEFSGHKHPWRLADAYIALDDVLSAVPNHFGGDRSCVYPWRIDGGMSYLVRHAWGDCPAGCINSVFWYFRVIDDNIEYVGRYQKWVDDEPDWWAQADDAFNDYRGYPE